MRNLSGEIMTLSIEVTVLCVVIAFVLGLLVGWAIGRRDEEDQA